LFSDTFTEYSCIKAGNYNSYPHTSTTSYECSLTD